VTLTVAVPSAAVGPAEPVRIGPVDGSSRRHVRLSALVNPDSVPFRVDGSVGIVVGEVNDSPGPVKVTVALFALSVPDQPPCYGVTAYCHDPAGTPFSVQVSALIVAEHAEPIDAGAPVPTSYRVRV
jgi:hypothetical protein